MAGESTFMRITNKDIYNKMIEDREINRVEHAELKQHQIQTNGKVRLNKWIATTALTLFTVILGIIITLHA